MDFTLDQKHEMARDLFKQFAETEVKPLARRLTRQRYSQQRQLLRWENMDSWAFLYQRSTADRAGIDLQYVMCVEELSKVCGTTGVIVSADTSLCIDPIMTFGTEEQKKKYVPDLASGKKIGAFGLTEPGAGTDAQGCQTTRRFRRRRVGS